MSGCRPEDVAAVYLATFFTPGRHGRWSRTARHWVPTIGDPSIQDVIASLAGDGPSLATFFLGDHDRTHLMALDADTPEGLEACRRVAEVLGSVGVCSYIERSRRGAHLWVILDAAVPAILARCAMVAAIVEAGYGRDPKLEVRPSADRRTSEFAGGSLRTPWQRHPETHERYGLLDPRTLEPLHRRIAGALLALELADATRLPELTLRYVPAERLTATATRTIHSDRRRSVTAVLTSDFGVEVEPGRSIRCPLHDDRHASAKVAPDDERLWCWSPSCPAHENGSGVSARMLAALAPVVRA